MKKFIVICFALELVFMIFAFPRLPGNIAIHWNAYGEADVTVEKALAILIFAGLAVGTSILSYFFATGRMSERFAQNKTVLSKVFVLVNCMVFSLVLVILSFNMGMSIDPARMGLIILGLTFIVLGNYIKKLRKEGNNIGIRNKWTEAPEVYKSVNAIGSYFIMAVGLFLVVTLAFTDIKLEYIVLALVTAVVLFTCFIQYFSYTLYKKGENNK